jgi:hypothetical protein
MTVLSSNLKRRSSTVLQHMRLDVDAFFLSLSSLSADDANEIRLNTVAGKAYWPPTARSMAHPPWSTRRSPAVTVTVERSRNAQINKTTARPNHTIRRTVLACLLAHFLHLGGHRFTSTGCQRQRLTVAALTPRTCRAADSVMTMTTTAAASTTRGNDDAETVVAAAGGDVMT